MFGGPIGKKMMIEQGYVPSTCIMHEALAGAVIYAEVSAGRDPCAGCNAGGNRSVCNGRPLGDSATQAYHSKMRMEEFTRERELQNAIDEDPTFSSNKIRAMWDASDPAAVGKAREERRIKEREEQRRRDAESEAISGKIYGLDEPITKG